MTELIPFTRWTPLETNGWLRRAYGRDVMLESAGGTLQTALAPNKFPGGIHLCGSVTGRMLVEVDCNGVIMLEHMVANDGFDFFIDLAPFAGIARLNLELHCIPATFGEISIGRNVDLLSDRAAMVPKHGKKTGANGADGSPKPRGDDMQRSAEYAEIVKKLTTVI